MSSSRGKGEHVGSCPLPASSATHACLSSPKLYEAPVLYATCMLTLSAPRGKGVINISPFRRLTWAFYGTYWLNTDHFNNVI